MLTASISSPSAGTSSPVLTKTMSPTTTSRRGTVVTVPPRITSTGSSSFTLFRIEKALLAFSSKMNASPVARKMAMKMPTGSKNPFQSCPRP